MTGKTRNNNLIPLRGVFALAKKDHAINEDPAAELENSKVQVPALIHCGERLLWGSEQVL